MSLSAFNALFSDETAAHGWFERARWINTRRMWTCREWDAQLTVTAGTPMHCTRGPRLSWLQAIHLIISSSKGISAKKLAEMIDVFYPTASLMVHRIRAMMA